MGNNQRLKRKIIFFAVAAIVCIMLSVFLNIKEYNKYNENYNKKINEICALIKMEYPEVSEIEIAKILNSENVDAENNLAKYGIDLKRDSAVYANELAFRKSLMIQISSIFLVIVFIFVVYAIMEKRRRDEIMEIVAYITQINKGNYELKIDKDHDDDMSILKNEVYKTMVMLKEAAEQSLRAKVNLKDSLSDISHQLKTPLTSLKINLENLEDSPELDADSRTKMIRSSMRDVNNINFMVQYILKLSRMDADAIEFKRDQVTVSDLVEEACEKVDAIRELKEIVIDTKVESDVEMRVDKYWQVEAIVNILKNAIEHGESKVDIKVQATSVFARIDISNDGKPISEKDMKHVFERFYRGEDTAKESVGIGLALSKMIVEHDGGYITVENDNGVTRFVIKYLF